MTIIIDHREPEKLKQAALQSLSPTPSIAHLNFGDFSIIGNGPEGKILIGIERKTVSDFYSSFTKGRLMNHQVPGMKNSYGICYLILEGQFYCSSDGYLTIQSGRGGFKMIAGMKYEAFCGILTSLQVVAGFIMHQTGSVPETLLDVQMIHNWWSRPWESHNACQVTIPKVTGAYNTPAPIVTRMLAQIDGVGLKRAQMAAKIFKTPVEMMAAS